MESQGCEFKKAAGNILGFYHSSGLATVKWYVFLTLLKQESIPGALLIWTPDYSKICIK